MNPPIAKRTMITAIPQKDLVIDGAKFKENKEYVCYAHWDVPEGIYVEIERKPGKHHDIVLTPEDWHIYVWVKWEKPDPKPTKETNGPYEVYDAMGEPLYHGDDLEKAKKIARDSTFPWVYHNGGRRKVHFGDGDTITLGKEVVIL